MSSAFGTTAHILPVVRGEELRSLHQRMVQLNPRQREMLKFGPRSARWNYPRWSLPTGLDAFASTFGVILGKPQGRD